MKAIGVADLNKYQKQGKPLVSSDAIRAKCAECSAKYVDGKFDCGISKCPLYPWMPYKGMYEDIKE